MASSCSPAARGSNGPRVAQDRKPQETERGYKFLKRIVGRVFRASHPAVDKGIQEPYRPRIARSTLIVDLKVTIFDGSYQDVDYERNGIQIAGSIGFKEA